jgi:hypothetical protein
MNNPQLNIVNTVGDKRNFCGFIHRGCSTFIADFVYNK